MENGKSGSSHPPKDAASTGCGAFVERFVKKTVFNVKSYDTDYDPETKLSTSTLNLVVTEAVVHQESKNSSKYPLLVHPSSSTAAASKNVKRDTKPRIASRKFDYKDEVKTGAVRKSLLKKNNEPADDSSDEEAIGDNNGNVAYHSRSYEKEDDGNGNEFLYAEVRNRNRPSLTHNYSDDEDLFAPIRPALQYNLEMKRRHMDHKEFISAEMVKKLYPEEDDESEEEAAAKEEEAPSPTDSSSFAIFELELDGPEDGKKKNLRRQRRPSLKIRSAEHQRMHQRLRNCVVYVAR